MYKKRECIQNTVIRTPKVSITIEKVWGLVAIIRKHCYYGINSKRPVIRIISVLQVFFRGALNRNRTDDLILTIYIVTSVSE
jgi:hypothetical protein